MIERRRSRLHGWGVFATGHISKNRRVAYYAGEKIPNRESVRREKQYLKRGRIWCFQLNRIWVIDAAVGGNIARFINHSCASNCHVQIVDQTIWIRASRPIRRGEELTYHYNTNGDQGIGCLCHPGCKTVL